MRMVADDPALDAQGVLAAVSYGSGPARATIDAFGPVPLLVLGNGRLVHAIWDEHGSVQVGRNERVHTRVNGDILFGYLEVDERLIAPPASVGGCALREASRIAYSAVFDTLAATGHRHLVRCWNYVPRINAPQGGLERYRHFNIGRQEAFLAANRAAQAGAPSACALGSPGGNLHVFFVASRTAPIPIENPRQVSAYHYPEQYGPRSPTFSRATMLALPDTDEFFISGTASIVGHESLHPEDPAAQAAESLANVEAVVANANRHARFGAFSMDQLCWKAYLRRPADLDAVQATVRARLGDAADVTWLQADICRAELLVEFEAFGFREAA
jgi:chorismate lyase/3-hydroxybenzoate synthase